MLFMEEVECGTAEEQNAEGRKWIEIHQDPGAGDSVNPRYGQQETQRGDDRYGEIGHVFTPF